MRTPKVREFEAGTKADTLMAHKAKKVATSSVFMVQLNGERDDWVRRDVESIIYDGKWRRSSIVITSIHPLYFEHRLPSLTQLRHQLIPRYTCRRSITQSAINAI